MTTSQVGNTHCHFYNQIHPDLMWRVSGETSNYRHKLKLKMSDMRSSEKRGNNNVTVISHNQDDENFKKLLHVLQLLLNLKLFVSTIIVFIGSCTYSGQTPSTPNNGT